ncbi:F-box protein At4g09920-like [Silene latifolia]|uniref:F-box protein At4g09920-like n=1 Tax=Silene latifolia TaxID=37657 RepID=UPI003D7848B7
MNYEGDDRRPTSLPSEILINILSFLPTKSAVATAILSRSWRHLWTHITALRFTITDFPEHKFNAIFFFIIRRVSWRHINTIELTINAHPNVRDPSSLTRLIHDIVYNGTNIKHLKVIYENYKLCTISLPTSIFKKQSLEALEVYAPNGVSLGDVKVLHKNPNLRKLLITIREHHLVIFDKLLKSWPLLEILHVHFNMVAERNHPIKIISQNLKWLSVNLVGEECFIDTSKIMLDTPKLEYFEVHSPIMVKFCFLKTPSGLLKAKLFMGDGNDQSLNLYSNYVMSVFNPILRVKTLKLSGDLLIALANLDVKVEVFHKLSHLEVGLSCRRSLGGVRRFLRQCPNVECLVLKKTCRAKWDGLNWSQINFLPLRDKIERIELWNFDGSGIICYIFSVAKGLKKLDIIIQIQNNGESANLKKIEISQELLALSKELPSCEINILLY